MGKLTSSEIEMATSDFYIKPSKSKLTKLDPTKQYKINGILQCRCGTTSYILDVKYGNRLSICPICGFKTTTKGTVYPLSTLINIGQEQIPYKGRRTFLDFNWKFIDEIKRLEDNE